MNMQSIDELLQQMKVWILSDGKMGHVNQSLGVAESLNIQPEIIQLQQKKYGKILGRISGDWAVKNKLEGPWPDMVIATGTLPGLVSGWIKEQHPETITIQMMTPPGKYYLYDLIAAPLHDGTAHRKNIIHTIGSPNLITPERLEKAKGTWQKQFKKMTNPLAVLVGGSNKFFTFTQADAEAFAMETVAFAKENGFKSLLVTTSRRTGEAQTATLQKAFESSGLPLYFWSGEGDNPYLAYLAFADAVAVTADSIGMISESCSAGLPVTVYGMEKMHSKKFQRFFKALLSQQSIVPFTKGKTDFAKDTNPLSDTQKVAGAIHGLILRHRL